MAVRQSKGSGVATDVKTIRKREKKRQRTEPGAFSHSWKKREEKQGEVKQNKSNADETELMCRDHKRGGERGGERRVGRGGGVYRTVSAVSVTTATSIILCCLIK